MSTSTKKEQALSAEMLREVLDYNPGTGVFTWRHLRYSKLKAGRVAGHVDSKGYHRIKVNQHQYGSHRLAWLYMTGDWPKEMIDHINGICTDNRFANLRLAVGSINQQNLRAAKSSNKTGLLGVVKVKDKFIATIKANGRVLRLGPFATAEEAHALYVATKRQLHPGCTI